MLNTNSGPNITLTPNSIALYKNEEGIGDFQKSWKGRSSVKGVGSTKGGILNRSGFLLQFSLFPHISYIINNHSGNVFRNVSKTKVFKSDFIYKYPIKKLRFHPFTRFYYHAFIIFQQNDSFTPTNIRWLENKIGIKIKSRNW